MMLHTRPGVYTADSGLIDSMDLHQKIRTLPTQPGCYLYKNAEGEVIYVGKAKNLRARVRSYFLDGVPDECEDRFADARGRGCRVHHGRERA